MTGDYLNNNYKYILYIFHLVIDSVFFSFFFFGSISSWSWWRCWLRKGKNIYKLSYSIYKKWHWVIWPSYFPSSDCTASPYFLCWKAHEGIKAATHTGYFNTLHSEKCAGTGNWLWLKRICRAANAISHVSWRWKQWQRKAALLTNIIDTWAPSALIQNKKKERVVGLESEHGLLHLLFSLGITNCKVLSLLPVIRPALFILVTLIFYYLLFILNSIPEDFAGLGWQCLIFADTISDLSHQCIFLQKT